MTPAQTAWIAEAWPASQESEKQTGFPALVCLAQATLESGWGQHVPCNNCFGIKSYPGDYGMQELTTCEVFHGVAKKIQQWFATFPSLAACFTKHASLITNSTRYLLAWSNYQHDLDVNAFVRNMAHIYATDPEYAGKLLTLMDELKPLVAA